MKGDFITPPAFSFPPAITVKIQDNLTLNQMHVFGSCSPFGSGGVRCGGGSAKATFKPVGSTPTVFRWKVRLRSLTLTPPFMGPVTVTIQHNSGVTRVDSITDCRQTSNGLTCRQF